jgi:hypothetical protein|tara:strand:- start:441 stop:1361 length:921 start_codon:yes stop_codon:yes gene_type:complete
MSIKFKDILLKEGYKGNMITGELPKRLDNTLFTLIHVLGGFDTSDVINFASNANHREKKLLSKMVDDLRLYDNVGVRGFDKESIKNSSRYRALTIFLKTIADTGGVNSLTEQISTTDPYFSDYVKPEYKKLIFKQWDKLGKADYNVLKYFDVVGEDKAFDNVADVVYPILALEWLGGVENTDFAQAPWMETSEMGFNKLKFKVEPIGFDYMYDESDNFGERGYSCWDIRVLIDKDGDLGLPINPEFIDNDYSPFIQDLFPQNSRDKLTSHRSYTEDQYELIEMLWEEYEVYRHWTHSFCRFEVVLV